MDQLIVTVWSMKSESNYTFGPFTEESADRFMEMVMDKDPDGKVWGNFNWTYLNSPEKFSTGDEI